LREIYPEFLFRNHSVIRSSVPLMQAAAAACEKRLDSDPVAEGMLAYFKKHIPEETGHDDWVLDDLETWDTAGRSVEAHTTASAAALAGRNITGSGTFTRCPAGFIACWRERRPRWSFSRSWQTASDFRGALSVICCCMAGSIPTSRRS